MNDAIPTPADSRLAQSLKDGRFALTAEVVPPVSADAADLLKKAEPLRALIDAVNVTDGAGAKVHMSSLSAAAVLAAAGIEPVMQLVCRDRNRIALLSDLLGAAALGVRNLLLLRGDDPSAGPYPDAKPVFDVESLDLVRWARDMSEGATLPQGAEDHPPPALQTPPRFFIGAADAPLDPPADWKPEGLERKIAAGAQFFQTQLSYDIGVVRRYFARLGEAGIPERVSILVGTGPIASAHSARWMNQHLWGVQVPEAVIERLEKAADPKAEGVAAAIEFLEELSEVPGVAGAHLMAPGNPAGIPAVIERAHLSGR